MNSVFFFFFFFFFCFFFCFFFVFLFCFFLSYPPVNFKFADNQGRHKFWTNFIFGPDQTVRFEAMPSPAPIPTPSPHHSPVTFFFFYRLTQSNRVSNCCDFLGVLCFQRQFFLNFLYDNSKKMFD